MEPLDYRSPAFVSCLFAILLRFWRYRRSAGDKIPLPFRQDSCFTNHIFMSVMLYYTLCPKAGYMSATDTRIPVSKDVRRDLRVLKAREGRRSYDETIAVVLDAYLSEKVD